MGQHIVKIKSIKKVTHDVLQIVTDKPSAVVGVLHQPLLRYEYKRTID